MYTSDLADVVKANIKLEAELDRLRARLADATNELKRRALIDDLPGRCQWGTCREEATGIRPDPDDGEWLHVCDEHHMVNSTATCYRLDNERLRAALADAEARATQMEEVLKRALDRLYNCGWIVAQDQSEESVRDAADMADRIWMQGREALSRVSRATPPPRRAQKPLDLHWSDCPVRQDVGVCICRGRIACGECGGTGRLPLPDGFCEFCNGQGWFPQDAPPPEPNDEV